jgi:glycosyltransferase involved in cell wall biosynthesis
MLHSLFYCFSYGRRLKYSFIIPTLNEEKLLPGLLKQLNDPEFRSKYDTEIIISDGGSKDSTIEIALKNGDIVKVHTNGKRQNIPGGRNEGAKYASGDILFFINADVLFEDIFVFFSFIDQNFIESDYLAMTCSVRVFPWEEKTADKVYHWVYNNYFKILNNIGIGMGRGECQIIRRDVFRQVSGYNEKLAAGEDFDLFRRIKKMGKILFTKDVYVFESPRRYRKVGYKNVTLSWMKNGFSVFLKNKSLDKEWEQVR